jgi:hypothetical protein
VATELDFGSWLMGDFSGLSLQEAGVVGTIRSSVSAQKQPLVDEESRRRNKSMNNAGDGGSSCLAALGFTFLTFNSAMAIYRSHRDLVMFLDLVLLFLCLHLLFLCLRLFERTPQDSPRRGWLKACVWVLTTLLTVMFSQKVAGVMPHFKKRVFFPKMRRNRRKKLLPSVYARGRQKWKLLDGR